MCIYLVYAVLLKNLQCYFYKQFWVYIYSLISVVNFSFTTEAFIYKLVYMGISDALFSDSCCYTQYQNIILFIIIITITIIVVVVVLTQGFMYPWLASNSLNSPLTPQPPCLHLLLVLQACATIPIQNQILILPPNILD